MVKIQLSEFRVKPIIWSWALGATFIDKRPLKMKDLKLKMVDGQIFQLGGNLNKRVKYKRFMNLCKKSVKFKEIKLGLKFYEGDIEMTVTQEPYLSKYMNHTLFIDVKKRYDDGFTTYTSMSLGDHNVINGGYNLYRIFKKKDDAIEYEKIAKSYSYWENGELMYKIKPPRGEKFVVDPTKYKVKESEYD